MSNFNLNREHFNYNILEKSNVEFMTNYIDLLMTTLELQFMICSEISTREVTTVSGQIVICVRSVCCIDAAACKLGHYVVFMRNTVI